MRKAGVAALLVVAATLVLSLVVANGDRRRVVQTTGVIITTAVATLQPQKTACQSPIITLDEISGVEFHPGAEGDTPAVAVEVRDSRSGATLATGRLDGGFDPAVPASVALRPDVPAERSVAVCFRNLGPAPLGVFGDDGVTSQCELAPESLGCRYGLPHPVNSTSSVEVMRQAVPGTIRLALLRREPKSVLSTVPDLFERASTFRPGFVSPALWWTLTMLLVIGAPLVLLWAFAGQRDADA